MCKEGKVALQLGKCVAVVSDSNEGGGRICYVFDKVVVAEKDRFVYRKLRGDFSSPPPPLPSPLHYHFIQIFINDLC